MNSGQGVQVSLEAVLTQNPDVVIGYEPEGLGITREALGRSGISFLASFVTDCPNPAPLYQNPTFDTVYDQVEFHGRIFNRQNEAAAMASLRGRVVKAQKAVPQGATPRTAAALFVPLGGGQLYTYGTRSMVDAQMETVGLKNVFGNVDNRDIEVNFEEVLGRNPDVLIILTSGDLQAGKDAFMSLPGVASLTAVRNEDILVMKFDYLDPPTPLSVEGLEKVAEAFGVAKVIVAEHVTFAYAGVPALAGAPSEVPITVAEQPAGELDELAGNLTTNASLISA